MSIVASVVTFALAFGAAPTPAQGSYFDSDGIRIHYIEQGAGDPLVLIHGLTADNRMWTKSGIVDHLARDFRVIALDCRGHGLSDKPRDPDLYGAKMGEDVIRLLDHLGLSKAHLVGYSMGTRIVGRLLVSHPHRIITATLGSGPARRWSDAEAQRAERDAVTIAKRGRSGEKYEWEPAGQDYAALAACIRGRRGEAVTDEEIANIEIPTLAIVGSEEKAVADLELMQQLLPTMRLIIIDGAQHSGTRATFLQPEFVDAVRDFALSHPVPPSS